ncbi:hypothetical protein MKX03_006441 [Papaver bracteatum]|nr:hypothetical protein MKX03_006441 [Papaver bracteatum]
MFTTKIYIMLSLYGHVVTMAWQVHWGASSVEGVEATLWQYILEKMKAPAKDEDIPVICPEQYREADGFLFGFPSRFGMMPAQCKAFLTVMYEMNAIKGASGTYAGDGTHHPLELEMKQAFYHGQYLAGTAKEASKSMYSFFHFETLSINTMGYYVKLFEVSKAVSRK